MRKACTTLAALILAALAVPARADDGVPPLAPAPPRPTRAEASLSFLPMAVGRFTSAPGGMSMTADAAFAWGIGLSANYFVRPGLSVGFAPQGIFNVKGKEDPSNAMEVDLLVRVAYTYTVVETIRLYAEVMPGYSLIIPSDGDNAKGPVLAFGGGCAMDVTNRIFATLGVGYQLGFQKLPPMDMSQDTRTKYARIALGGGMRF